MIHVKNGQPALLLAPMEGVTDAPMRALLTERGGFSFCVSEFIRISQEVPPKKTFLRLIPELAHESKTPSGIPVQIQLLGGDPVKLAESAIRAVELGTKAIDINFGCPAPTVNRNDGGATLLKYPDRIRSIVREVRRALPPSIPVSAKLRLSWDDPSAIHLNSSMAIEGGASWITIHGRTRLQGYIPPAFWEPIGEVKKRAGIPVIANGEIWTLEDFKRCRDITGSEHFMIGRGALANPVLPLQIARELGFIKNSLNSNIYSLEWAELFKRFVQLGDGYSDKPLYMSCRIKQWTRMIHQRSQACPWFERIKPLKDVDEILHCISKYSQTLS